MLRPRNQPKLPFPHKADPRHCEAVMRHVKEAAERWIYSPVKATRIVTMPTVREGGAKKFRLCTACAKRYVDMAGVVVEKIKGETA